MTGMARNHNRIALATLLLLWCGGGLTILSGQAQQQRPLPGIENWRGPKMRISVQNLSGSALRIQQITSMSPSSMSTVTTVALPPPAEFALGLTEMLTTALVSTGRFVVLERATIEAVKGEQDLGEAGRVRKETAASAGNITGAQAQITGDITEFSYQRSNAGGNLSILRGIKTRGERVTALVALDIRLIDAVTSEVTWSKRFSGTASMTGMGAEVVRGTKEVNASGSKNTPLGKASREAIEAAVSSIVSSLRTVPWTGRVVDVREGKVYLNAGSELGILPGMEFDILDRQAALIDPETGRTLGAPERKVCRVGVETVTDAYSIARAIGPAAASDRTGMIRRGQLVRMTVHKEAP